MSRVPQYPASSSRQRYPQNTNGNGYYPNGGPAATTSAIPPVRPTSHTESVSSGGSTIKAPNGPARPVRSELRSRQSSQNGVPQTQRNGEAADYRDRDRDRGQQQFTPSRSIGNELRSRQQQQQPHQQQQIYANNLNASRSQPIQQQRPSYNSERTDASWTSSNGDAYGGYDDDTAYQDDTVPQVPAALNRALTAFKDSRGRRRTDLANGIDDAEGRERDRAREREREREKIQIMQARQDRRAGKNRPTKAGDIDAVLDQIQDEWAFVTEADFNPVTLALSLLDKTAAGRDLESFQQTKYMLEQSLRGTIDRHYQHFAAALPHHSSLLTSLSKVQTEMSDARSKLQETRDALGTKRADLVQLWSRGQVVEEMMRLLDEIEHLKSVPDILETRISEKRLLHASVLAVRSSKMIKKQELQEIGALTDLRSYLAGQENALRDIIIEELQSHLYLKAYWSESLWAPYTHGQQQLPALDAEDDPPGLLASPKPNSSPPSKLNRFLNDLAVRQSNESPADTIPDSELMNNAPSTLPSSISLNNFTGGGQHSGTSNAEISSFEYIENLVESLAVLGKLGSGLDTVAQRLPMELFNLVETTINEVRERADQGKRASMNPPTAGRPSSMYVFAATEQYNAVTAGELRLAALESHAKGSDREALMDLFWTLYSKLDAVLQGLRVLYEVSNRIGSRRDFKDSAGAKPGTLFPLMDIWAPIQNEIRSLLRDYLADQEQGAMSGRRPVASINEVLRHSRLTRDRSRFVFRLVDTDVKATTKSIKGQEEEVAQVLKESVPGLVSGGVDVATQSTLSASLAIDDRFGSAGSHSRLIKPDAFHVAVLIQPTLAFQSRVAQVMPHGMAEASRAGTVFLDEFVSKVYLPQLEEKVSTLFQAAATGADAFQEDPASNRLSPKPLAKASTHVLALVNSLCSMHRSTPFHRESYSRLILDVIIRFYQRCYDRFVELVSLTGDAAKDPETRISVSARWAQKGEVTACLSALLSASPESASLKKRLCRQETRVELSFLTQETISRTDLVPSTQNILDLGLLYQSLTWLIKNLHDLESTSSDVVVSPADEFAPSVVTTPVTPVVEMPRQGRALQLPLTKAMAMRYDALLKAYEQLAELVIHTIRVEVRCRVIHFLDLAMRQGNYRIEHEALEPEAYIVDLNQDLSACEDCTGASLPERERRFIFEGLGTLMEHVLISNARYIRFANKLGIQKIFRNILALQQNLKTLSDMPEDAEFARARKYYELFLQTPEQMLESASKRQYFSFDEYKSMLCLQCGVDQTLGEAAMTDSNLNMHLIELHGLVVDDWEDTNSQASSS